MQCGTGCRAPNRQSAPCNKACHWEYQCLPQASKRTCDGAGHDACLQVGTRAAGVYAVLRVQRPVRCLPAGQLRSGVLKRMLRVKTLIYAGTLQLGQTRASCYRVWRHMRHLLLCITERTPLACVPSPSALLRMQGVRACACEASYTACHARPTGARKAGVFSRSRAVAASATYPASSCLCAQGQGP